MRLAICPERNEKITIDGIEFKVINADTRRLIQLRATLPVPQEAKPTEN